MLFLRTLMLLLALVATLATAQAAKYGMAGCGVGSLIFEDRPGKVQILAGTTNDYFVQSSSISSGTSNCVEMNSRAEASLYITVNQEALAKDISRGAGETLTGLAQVLRCSNADELGNILQRNYSKLFPSPKGSMNLSDSIEQTVKSNSSLRANCALHS